MTRCYDDCTYSTDAVHTRRDYTCYSSESQTYAFIPMPVITATRYYHISVWAQPGSLPKVLNKYHLWSCCLTPPPHQPCMLSSDTDSPSRCCETLWYHQTKPIFISLSLCHWLTYSCWSCSPCPYPLCPSKLYFYCESRRLRVSSCAFGNLFCSPCVYKGTVDQWWR